MLGDRRLSLASSSSSDADSQPSTPHAYMTTMAGTPSGTLHNSNPNIVFADNVTLSNFEKMVEYSPAPLHASPAMLPRPERGNNQLICALPSPEQSIEAVPGRARMLFSHCRLLSGTKAHWLTAVLICGIVESFIASKMVVLDYRSNGYRSVLLPLACQSDMVNQAVSVVSAFHLSQEQPELRMEAETRQQKILTTLRQSSSVAKQSSLFSITSWATILTLLVGDTMTGSSNYIKLLDLLSHLSQACAQDETLSADTKKFIAEQTQM